MNGRKIFKRILASPIKKAWKYGSKKWSPSGRKCWPKGKKYLKKGWKPMPIEWKTAPKLGQNMLKNGPRHIRNVWKSSNRADMAIQPHRILCSIMAEKTDRIFFTSIRRTKTGILR